MYRKQVRRRRATLVLLVVACLVLISTHFSEGDDGPLHSAQSGVGSILAPLEEGANRALKPARDLVNWFDETFQARGENEELRAEVRDLREDLTNVTETLEEGRERGEIAEITAADELAGFEPVEARVIGRSPSTWTQTLSVDKGGSAGLEVDDAVITGDGLVGRVSAVNGGSAQVALLTDQDTDVAAKVLKGGPQGIVTAAVGDLDSLVLELISNDDEVDPRATVVTSGFGDPTVELRSRFPPAIPIGEVRQSDPGEQELRQQITIEPFADFDRIEFVTVLTRGAS